MKFSFRPTEGAFYELFTRAAQNLVRGTELLNELALPGVDVQSVSDRLTDVEHDSDQITHDLYKKINSTFITPFDREDIHTLVGRLDDIIDTIDALAKRFPIFHVKEMEPAFVRQTEVLAQAAAAVNDAVHRLRKSRKLSDLSDKLIEIHERESVGDDNHHAALSRLFAGGVDPLEVMKWKELYDYIENAIDACEDVGNTLERIVLKNG